MTDEADAAQWEPAGHAIPLAQVITALRQELEMTLLESQEHSVQFQVEDIELELNVGLSRQAAASDGVQFWVFTLGANTAATASTTHTIRLSLNAQKDLRLAWPGIGLDERVIDPLFLEPREEEMAQLVGREVVFEAGRLGIALHHATGHV